MSSCTHIQRFMTILYHNSSGQVSLCCLMWCQVPKSMSSLHLGIISLKLHRGHTTSSSALKNSQTFIQVRKVISKSLDLSVTCCSNNKKGEPWLYSKCDNN